MNENKLTPEQLQALLQYASKMFNTTTEQLAKTVNNNGVESLASKLPSSEAAKFQEVVSDKDKIEKMLNSPQAQKLIQQLMNQK